MRVRHFLKRISERGHCKKERHEARALLQEIDSETDEAPTIDAYRGDLRTPWQCEYCEFRFNHDDPMIVEVEKVSETTGNKWDVEDEQK